jgi:ArsR family transcriptional regulator
MKRLSTVFKALADESRLRILNLLFQSGELCVCDIESTLKFTQTKVSRHMGYLKRIGLIEDRRQGRWVLYSIAKPKTDEQEAIIKSVKAILESHSQAKKDTAKLFKNITAGCCATFNHVKPNQLPAKLSLN